MVVWFIIRQDESVQIGLQKNFNFDRKISHRVLSFSRGAYGALLARGSGEVAYTDPVRSSFALLGWYGIAWLVLSLHLTLGDRAFRPEPLSSLLAANLLQHLPWVPAGLLLAHLGARFPVRGIRDAHRIILGASAVLLMAGLTVSVAFLVTIMLLPAPAAGVQGFLGYWGWWFPQHVLVLGLVTAAHQAYGMLRRMQERELLAAALEARTAQARHEALRWQLQPHFLFNTLNSISALVHSDPERADTMLSRLGVFLRMTLEGDTPPLVALRREVSLLEAYLAIEQVRFGDRLKVVWEMPAGLLERRVPHLLLQPLVENAVVHGFARQARQGTLTLRAREEGTTLVLEVMDDGCGLTQREREGVGVQNIRARLGLYYGESGSLTLHSIAGKGTLAVIRVPRETVSCVLPS